MAGANEELEQQLLSWYSEVLNRRVDLIGDYAGNELFLIEGDSLLLHCLSTSEVDLEDGFQVLHAVYAVEKFLDDLSRRKGNFHIVFFDSHASLCHNNDAGSKELLVRQILIRHLQMNLQDRHPKVKVQIFSSIPSDKFVDYLTSTGAYFLMCHDGASVTSSRHASDESPVASQAHGRLQYRYMIYEFIRLGYNVALVNGLEFRDSKVITTVLESHGKPPPVLLSPPLTPSIQDDMKSYIGLEKLQSSQTLEKKKNISERDVLNILPLCELLSSDSSGSNSSSLSLQASAFILHAAILRLSPLTARRFVHTSLSPEDNRFLLLYSQQTQRLLQSHTYQQVLGNCPSQCGIADLLDGRVFAAITNAFDRGLELPTVDPLLLSEYDRLATIGKDLCDYDLPTIDELSLSLSKMSIQDSSAQATETRLPFSPSVMSFQNAVFDPHLISIKLNTDKAIENGYVTTAKVFEEVSHWHNSKKPLDSKFKVTKLDPKALKRNQRFMAEMVAYAGSLTNAVGKVLEPETIIASAKTHGPDKKQQNQKNSKINLQEKAPKPNPKNKKGGKVSGTTAAHATAAAGQAKRDEKLGNTSVKTWASRCKDLEELQAAARYSKALKFLEGLKPSEVAIVGAEYMLYAVNALILDWKLSCKQGERDLALNIAALIFDHIRRLSQMTGLTKTIVSKIELTTKTLRLPQVAVSAPPETDRALCFPFALDGKNLGDLSISVEPTEFQLRHCGPYLDRSMDSGPDDRVPFEPDGWQKRVLDAIDARKSLFVVAPTSAGKTFISFYAMKQILQSNNDDVLVYVAPTKALVNQIAAEIQARFSKTFNQAGRSVWAIHTRDYRINSPTGCQILVTVPHILQIMLLAPSNAQKSNSWSCRVKRIIFDEVHCIGQAEDGIIWEQLLLLAPCPIIALSATVGNPEEFNKWLESTQASIGSDLVMVVHPHRYSDLRKFLYTPPKKFCFGGLAPQKQRLTPGLDTSSSDTNAFAFVHPIASLINRSRGMPDDLSLEARDCFTLWQSMNRRQTSHFRLEPSLHPSRALPEVVRKRDVFRWEAALKGVVKEWMADSGSPFEEVRKDLQAALDATKPDEMYMAGLTSEEDCDNVQTIDAGDLCATTLPMLSDLHSRDALPGILFNYDRTHCEKICMSVLTGLKDAEDRWKSANPRWGKKILEYEKWKKQQENQEGKKGAAGDKGKKQRNQDDDEKASKADQQRDKAGAESSKWESFDPDEPLEQFTFANTSKLLASELEEFARQLRWLEQADWLIEALKRGIAVHHAGMNRKYRQTVERLFRKGYLRVVIATGTLALGINMPCKTVIFSGDSVFLTALNFRQCAGRAGRRGFDSLGNVIFQGIPLGKVYRLLSSRLPDLNGHFPISTTLVLRLCTLLHESQRSQYAVKAINSLLSQPRLCLGGAESKLTVLHHLRFSIEYLRRQSLLDAGGVPLDFAGCVSHLYFTENSSFAFHALLRKGYFHELCSDIRQNPERVLSTLVLVLAHLFGRVPTRHADQEWKEKLAKSPSVVFLPDMPEAAKTILRKHNDETLDIFKTYVGTYVEQHIEEPDRFLPLTGLKCGGDKPLQENDTLKPLPPTNLRSPFVALSGHGDQFKSIGDLCRSVRSGVFLEEAAIPYIAIAPDETGGPLNAYLYDFFKHGNIHALVTANGIRRGDVWFWLNDFSLVLATIITSLTNFVSPSSDGDMDLIDLQGGGDRMTTSNHDKAADGGGSDDMSNADTLGGGDTESGTAGSAGGPNRLLKVLEAFEKLKAEFDEKFRKMWA